METGLTVLLTTHYLDEAHQLADRVGILDQGRLAAEGTPDGLIDELGSDTIILRGSGSTDSLREKLQSLQFVQTVSAVDDGLLVGVESSSRHLADVVSEAARSEFSIEDVSVSKPDLGAVFAKYTGHKLQNGDAS